MGVTRKRIVMHGTVQGVGLRFRARHAADMLGITGWIRNERDGSVTMEAQGEDGAAEKLLEIISGGTFVDIERTETSSVPVREDERGFRTLHRGEEG